MSTSEAPYTYAQTTLVRANPAQTEFTRKDTFPLWGEPKGFDLEMYLERDRVMEREEWSVNGGFATWVLVPRDDLHTTEKILAHCETYRRPALIRLASDTEPRPVECTGIACVFVNPVFAKYKYAKHMLSLLHYVQAPANDLPAFPHDVWGQEPNVMGEDWKRDVKFSVLYSGVGKNYYASARMGSGKGSRPGWVFKHTETRTFDVDLGDDKSFETPKGWTLIDADGVRRMEDVAAGIVSQRMSEGDVRGQARVAVLPTRGTLYSHCLRDKLSANTITSSRSRTYGIVGPRDDPSTPAPLMTYFFETASNVPQCMFISFVNHPVPFSVVRSVMKREGCSKVEVWGQAGDAWTEEQGMIIKDDNVPALAVYGDDLDPEQVEWQFNDKYVAC